jgi:hypothetical protein
MARKPNKLAPYSSLLDIVPDCVREGIEKINDETLLLTEIQLRAKVKPTATEYALRVSFWRQFELSMETRRQMTVDSIIKGICWPHVFHAIFRSAYRSAWLIKPIMKYERKMEAILERATERLEEIINLPITSNGKTDLRAAHIVLSACKQIEDRVKGMAVARSINKHEHREIPREAVSGLSAHEIDQKIIELETEIDANGSPPSLMLPSAITHGIQTIERTEEPITLTSAEGEETA